MSVDRWLGKKLHGLRDEFARNDVRFSTKALRVAERALTTLRLSPAVAIVHEQFYELGTPPPLFRGLRDLTVRRGGPADAAALAELDASRTQVDRRFARHDIVYLGELEGRVLAQVWFHRGPEPFDEDAELLGRFALASDTFWSYAAFAVPEARLSGVFAKVFQNALREVLTVHGAARVRCRVKTANARSIALHDHTGFRLIGTITALALPGMRAISWRNGADARWWLQRRSVDSVMALPPERA
jgi:RimJ/RimL family protein N-acetyltransferase